MTSLVAARAAAARPTAARPAPFPAPSPAPHAVSSRSAGRADQAQRPISVPVWATCGAGETERAVTTTSVPVQDQSRAGVTVAAGNPLRGGNSRPFQIAKIAG